MANVLLVGESWVSSATHYKGFDQFGSVTFHLGAEPFVRALEGAGHGVTWMKAHEAAEGFPFEMEGLAPYDVLILSDIGANTILLPPEVWLHSRTVPNRLKLIREWVRRGGGLLMAGGYFSFQGIDGRARWRRTAGRGRAPRRLPALGRPRGDPRGLRGRDRGRPPGAGGLWAAPGPRSSASTRWSPRRAPRCWPGCPRTRAATRSSCSAATGRAAPPPGRATWGPTGSRPPVCEWEGYARLWGNLIGWLARR